MLNPYTFLVIRGSEVPFSTRIPLYSSSLLVHVLLPLLLTRNCLERILPLLLIQPRNGHGPTVNTYHVIAIQPVYWRVGRFYRKHSFLYCCVLDRVYRAFAWQRIDQICYNTLNSFHIHSYSSFRIIPPINTTAKSCKVKLEERQKLPR
jgi:hypothetical protein